MKYTLVVICIIAVVAVLGCTTQYQPIKEISISEHGDIAYTFDNDVRQSVFIKSDHQRDIFDLFRSEKNITFIFNGTSEEDNALFRLVLFNIWAKIPTFIAYEGISLDHTTYYFVDEPTGTQWYDSQKTPIEEPNPTGIVLMVKGPATGANETSVRLVNKTIIVQGTDAKNLTLAADKLVLMVFGIDVLNPIFFGKYNNEINKRIICIGDSIMAGAKFEEGDATFCDELGDVMNITVTMFAYPGADAATMRSWIDEFEPRPEGTALIMLGINDIERNHDASEFRDNIKYIIDKLQSKKIPVILIVPPNINFADDNNKTFSPQQYEEIRNVIIDLGKSLSLRVIDMNNVLDSESGTRFDIVHPNSYGHHLMARAFLDQCPQCFFKQ